MGYYAKDDYVLLRDEVGSTTEGALERWSPVRKTWGPYSFDKRHLGQNVLMPISDKAAAALKKGDGGPMQPASAIGGGKGRKP